jgi:hypothetical protein
VLQVPVVLRVLAGLVSLSDELVRRTLPLFFFISRVTTILFAAVFCLLPPPPPPNIFSPSRTQLFLHLRRLYPLFVALVRSPNAEVRAAVAAVLERIGPQIIAAAAASVLGGAPTDARSDSDSDTGAPAAAAVAADDEPLVAGDA